jgi:hypothetical protein
MYCREKHGSEDIASVSSSHEKCSCVDITSHKLFQGDPIHGMNEGEYFTIKLITEYSLSLFSSKIKAQFCGRTFRRSNDNSDGGGAFSCA